jgi:16S rRNA G966 N2-methylase RsmD
MNLTDRDKEIIRQHLDRNEPLPAKYKLMLFADAPEVELDAGGLKLIYIDPPFSAVSPVPAECADINVTS